MTFGTPEFAMRARGSEHSRIAGQSRNSVRSGRKLGRTLMLGTALALLAACEDGQMPAFLQPSEQAPQADGSGRSVKLVERDVEAPEIFQVTEAGLWDGRPSLGGVWVAHPDVGDPERVIIRNTTNNKFVIGALFRKERATPGPRIQVSSDAAAALGMLAGQPVNLNVTALRREEVEEAPAETAPAEAAVPPPSDVTAAPLEPADSAAATAAAAIEAADAPAPASDPAPAPKPAAKPASTLAKPFIQIGIFSVEQNAKNTAAAMRGQGMVPTIRKQSARGKTFWRVLVGPATSSAERAALLKKIKAAGFADAYAVTN